MTLEQIIGIHKRSDSGKYVVEELLKDTGEPSWRKYQKGDDTASSAVLLELQPTIDKAINNFGGADPGLKTKARLIALDSVKSFDSKKGASLSTFVYGNLQKLLRERGERSNLTHLPENVSIMRSKLKDAIKEWEIEHDEEPTTDQLADKTGISVKRIDAVMNYKPITPDSLTVSPEGDQLVGADSGHALDLYNRVIYNELDSTDKKIYEWSTGFGKGVKLSGVEIARRLKMSPAAVSKRYAKISNKFSEGRELVSMVVGNAV